MSMRWRVHGIPLEAVNMGGGSHGEPFAAIRDKIGNHIILTKEPVMYEGDEDKSSFHERNQQMERERG